MAVASIVIPLYGRCALTKQCLESVVATCEGLDYEVILVDNASPDETPALLDRLSGDVTVIRNRENLGFAKACNQGWRAASGQFVVFLNNDTVATSGWLEALHRGLLEPGVAVVGARLLYPRTETIQHAGVVAVGGMPMHLHANVPKDDPRVTTPRDFDMVTGACMALPRAVLTALDGFDEAFINGLEDIDLCLKVRALGGRVRYCADAVLYHYESQSDGRFAYAAHNVSIFLNRWARCFSPPLTGYGTSQGASRFLPEFAASLLRARLETEPSAAS
ncbi:MAG TPA: glycosyltransferase family 2 protein [Candidatus Dormibacteraeota bacterium]|nr:glycosyltransferase family 2 protein [Candidatus Dormibacteraeota bacterium]